MLKHVIIVVLFVLFAFTSKGQSVFITPSGAKYHVASCKTVKNVSREMSIAEALKSGFSPCKICHPAVLKNIPLGTIHKAKGETSSRQCKGTTKAGKRCKHHTRIGNKYCFQHVR